MDDAVDRVRVIGVAARRRRFMAPSSTTLIVAVVTTGVIRSEKVNATPHSAGQLRHIASVGQR
jgi:hypothetical protein